MPDIYIASEINLGILILKLRILMEDPGVETTWLVY